MQGSLTRLSSTHILAFAVGPFSFALGLSMPRQYLFFFTLKNECALRPQVLALPRNVPFATARSVVSIVSSSPKTQGITECNDAAAELL